MGMEDLNAICDGCSRACRNDDLQMCAACGMDALCFECITNHDCVFDAEEGE